VLTPFLPPKQEYVLAIHVTELQEKMYRYYLEFESIILASDEAGSRTNRGTNLFKDYHNLQRIWTHPLMLKWHWQKQQAEVSVGRVTNLHRKPQISLVLKKSKRNPVSSENLEYFQMIQTLSACFDNFNIKITLPYCSVYKPHPSFRARKFAIKVRLIH